MKSSAVYSPFTALALKIVGLIMIVSALLDYIILAIPFNPVQREWQLTFTTQVVDRGIIPMVGIALLLAGYWVSSSVGALERKPAIRDLRFWVLILSSLLGLVYLLLVPLHFNNIRAQSNQALQQIEQQAGQAETQLEAQSQQIDALIQNPDRISELDRAIESGQVQGEQLARLQTIRQQLETFKQNPEALNQQLEQAQNQIRSGKQEAAQKARVEALKLGLRTGLSSLLLAIGYIALGWIGLRSLGNASAASRPKA